MTNISKSESSKQEPGEELARVSCRAARSKPEVSAPSKTDLVLKKLRMAKGATVAQLADATGWQAHSVRGLLSGTVKKKLGLNLVSEVGKDGARRYRVIDDAEAAS